MTTTTGRSWRIQADQALRQLAKSGQEFSADDLLDAVGHPEDSHAPNAQNNAIGALFRDASKAGLIEAVGVRKSKQPHRKGGIVRVWRGIEQATLF